MTHFLEDFMGLMDLPTNSTPERRLLVALLRRALFDYVSGATAERRAAKEWLFDEAGPDDDFSFRWVCQQLDFQPDMVLSRIKSIRPNSLKPSSHWWSGDVEAAFGN